jgi:hypothetical protein
MEDPIQQTVEASWRRTKRIPQRPIFIHGMFRTGGTYLWSKFRRLSRYRAYYEPLNEVLASPEEEVRASARQYGGEVMRHPEADFYFAEFPFKPGGGVEHFDESLSFERYALAEDAIHPTLRRYFAHLLAYSLAHQQVPVFKLDRALLRTGWLNANFSPINLLVLRNPLDVWESFKSFGEDFYFKPILCLTLARNRDHSLIGDLANRLGLPMWQASKLEKVLEHYLSWTREAGGALYPFFFEFYVLTTLHSARYAHCILDMTGISSDAVLKAAASNRLSQLGVQISLEDCHMPSRPQPEAVLIQVASIEQACLDRLRGRLPVDFLVPEDRLSVHVESVSDYFRRILGMFQAPAAGEVAVQSDARLPEKWKNQQMFGLAHVGGLGERAESLAEMLQHAQTAELWNQWAKAQAACGHTVSAIAGVRRALELNPQYEAASRNLRLVLCEHKFALARAARFQSVLKWLNSVATDSLGLRVKRLIGAFLRAIWPRWPGSGQILIEVRTLLGRGLARYHARGLAVHVDEHRARAIVGYLSGTDRDS